MKTELPLSDLDRGSAFSPAPSGPPSEQYSPSADEATPHTKRKRGAAAGSGKTRTTKTKAASGGGSGSAARGIWTAEKCAQIMELIITEAMKKGDVDGMAKKVRLVRRDKSWLGLTGMQVGVTRKQLTDQMCENRANLRATVIKTVYQAKGGKGDKP